MRTVYVTIGRNIGNEPMPEDLWESFRREALECVWHLNGDIVAQGTIEGIWEGEFEEAFTVHFTISDNMENAEIDRLFALLDTTYKQDAIAVAVAEPRFVGQATLV